MTFVTENEKNFSGSWLFLPPIHRGWGLEQSVETSGSSLHCASALDYEKPIREPFPVEPQAVRCSHSTQTQPLEKSSGLRRAQDALDMQLNGPGQLKMKGT